MSAELDPELLQVDALLRRAAGGFAYPATPRIAEAVSARLRAETPRPRLPRLGLPALRLAGAIAGLLFALVIASLVVPQSRDALADFFGLSSVRVDREPYVGPTPPVLSPGNFAQPSTLEEARAEAGFSLRFLERDSIRYYPDEVYLQNMGTSAVVVIFVYDNFEFYQGANVLFGKGGFDPDLIDEVAFDGRDALWIDQGGHIARSFDAQGRVIVESVRSVEVATLLWEEDGVTYRIETELSMEEAFELARTLR